jgi:DNA-binding CsgD family transcriptional regulator
MKKTERQEEVLDLVQQGSSNKVIANKLDIAVSTVKAHVSELLRKYGSSNRSQLAVNSLQGKTVETPDLEESPFGWVKKINNKIVGILFTAIQPYKGWLPVYLKDEKPIQKQEVKDENST